MLLRRTAHSVLPLSGRAIVALVVGFLMSVNSAFADEVQLVSGIGFPCTIKKSTQKYITVLPRGSTREMTIPMAKVHAITTDGKRRVVNPRTTPRRKESPPQTPRKTSPTTDSSREPAVEVRRVKRTKSQTKALIAKAGKTAPEWWDSVKLDYPQTLDLTWQKPPEGQWDPQRYLGPYIISKINPNPHKWQGAVKLLHHTLEVNKGNSARQSQSMERLGHVYGHLLGDYARAAYWWQRTAKLTRRVNAIGLADCYWKLGCKEMAKELLVLIEEDRSGAGSFIKLWSDIGELRKALSLAERKARSHFADVAYRAAGDACRSHGKYEEALAYYEKVFAVPSTGRRAQGINKNKQRARACVEAIKVFEALDLAKIPDGTYAGAATGYRGPVQVQVKVQKAAIESVKVTQHKEDWFYTSLTDVPRQIVERQGVRGVDAVTGATMTSEAIINATAKALASGLR